jgi:OOP family OmpA-OmpF porin
MRILIIGFIGFLIWSFLSMWLYVDILKPAAKPQVVVQPVPERPDRVADSLAKLYASMPKDLKIYFDFDRSKMITGSNTDTSIAAFRDWLEKYPSSQLLVTGYSDFIGTSEYNLKLAMDRTEIVRSYLESKGIPAERMISEAKGRDLTIPYYYTAEGRALSRRTEISIKK